MDAKFIIANNIRVIRKLVGVSCRRVADDLGIVRQTLTVWENGANAIPAHQLARIADYLGVDIACFFEGVNTNESSKRRISPQLPPS